VRSTRWGLAACWSKAGRSASISSDVREQDQTSEKSLTLIEIGLTAAIVAIKGNEPLILAASGSDPDKLAGLPLGPFEAEIQAARLGGKTAGMRLRLNRQFYC
jgi:hypothetical protein